MSTSLAFTLYSLFLIVGLFIEVGARRLHYILTKKHYKEHHFSFGKYLFLLLFPLLGTLIIINLAGPTLFLVFIIFALVGTVLEWFVGWAYYQIEGQRLWTYHRYAITKKTRYTSLLSIPIWGMGGIIFWLIASLFI